MALTPLVLILLVHLAVPGQDQEADNEAKSLVMGEGDTTLPLIEFPEPHDVLWPGRRHVHLAGPVMPELSCGQMNAAWLGAP